MTVFKRASSILNYLFQKLEPILIRGDRSLNARHRDAFPSPESPHLYPVFAYLTPERKYINQ